MISGFAQLRCGLSTYHWQRIVNTAWFASVTHLCCLTFLRDHLLHNRVTQLWRVPGMVVLTSMIIYALTTTSQYDWLSTPSDSLVTPSDQAICYLNPSFDLGVDRKLRLAISIVFLGFGMINRLRRLYHAPNIILTKVRDWCSHKARCYLMHLYGKGSADSVVTFLVAVLVYRPLLALFLMARLLMDGVTSMAFEVSCGSLYKQKRLAEFTGMLGDACFHLGQPKSVGGDGNG
jgi:hypothetical protein